MNELHDILLAHASRHPAMQASDLVKLIYQNEFGCGHLIPDPAYSLARLKSELEATPYAPKTPLFEPIGNDLMRLDLTAFPSCALSAETLNALFVCTAHSVTGSMERFHAKLNLLRGMVNRGEIRSCTPAELDKYLQEYEAQGCPPTRHSAAYRAAEHPAYRVLSAHFAPLFPFFAAVDALQGDRLLVGIDGRCAAGKSTLARLAAQVYTANLISMDDFFLPPERKTPERLCEPGGNVDYERFKAEVLEPFRSGAEFSYRPYRCHPVPGFLEPVQVPLRRLTFVEGSYAHHPFFAQPYQLTVFLTVDPQTQRERLLRRDGPQLLSRFEQEWIPLEEAYFSAYSVETRADLRLCPQKDSSLQAR